ncbi:hypothetical protein DICPUDRAFT_160449 [Dictyostelium purpureum]|uniref:Uncharacterized protein n=1 Tax=Dictyostelium purpureum TaxID=5786 RepID=F1A6C5_DICPU|nr:uncharacterized protein DICPUDRAFT_160449 [Dictyostelium purpureum]EGC28256.1 hypothetical protein DICPUDRAFT_160449 [Dictyostelium purpureum]|eukprot:XP_003295219.1 hypothetical protein DICPUDRAFT_160449 [Dictyostelium purpureum]
MESFIREQLKLLVGTNNSVGIRDKFDATFIIICLIMKKHEFRLHPQPEPNDPNNINNEPNTSLECAKNTLPKDWNKSDDSFTVDFSHDLTPLKKYHIKCLRMGTLLLVNAMIKDKQDKICTLDIDIEKLISNTNFSDVENLLTNLKEFIAIYEFNIINQLVPGLIRVPNGSPQVTTTSAPNTNNQRAPPQRYNDDYDDPLRIGPPQRPPRFIGDHGRGVGDPDLYPPGFPQFGNQPFLPPNRVFPGGGSYIGRDHPGFGDIHNPYRDSNDPYGQGLPGWEQRMPRGAVPPGARFDPFGPPTGGNINNNRGNRNNYGGPDRDDFGPPGFSPNGFI